MKKYPLKRGLAVLTAAALLAGCAGMAPALATDSDSSAESFLSKITGLSVGEPNTDGGVAEIVKFNPDNQKLYLVSGQTKNLDIIPANGLGQADSSLGAAQEINVGQLTESNIQDFTFGDLTSVAISSTLGVVALAVQHADYNQPGQVLLLSYDGAYIASYPTGIQPDMLTFTDDGKTLLVANEGEPREGYGENVTDPAGSVSILKFDADPAQAQVTTADFTAFDAQRANLVQSGVMLKKGADPSVDFEPEYIAVNADGTKAYVTLQEANAIATVDIAAGTITRVSPLGYKDYSSGVQKLDLYKKDAAVDISNQPYYGAYMPDGIASFEQDGKAYLLTANEGDAREWGDEGSENFYLNEKEIKKQGVNQDSKVVTIDPATVEGLPEGNPTLFGGRSFSVWDAETMEQVYDSAADFETITNEKLPNFFNCSNDNVEKKDRSGKKGPEPEEVCVGVVNGVPYAFIALERVGGVMSYSLADIANPTYTDYLTTRDYSADIAGDVAPEGLCFVQADDSPTSYPLLIAANEVSGTVSVNQFRDGYQPTINLLHTNDMHGAVTSGFDSQSGAMTTVGADELKTMKQALPHALLVDGGDATQGGSLASLSQGADIIQLMNEADYDAMVAGNHEFDYGLDQLKANAKAASFPILSANSVKDGQPVLKGEKYAGESKTNQDGASVILEPLDGVQVGIFGLTTPETAVKTNPEGIQGVSFANVTATAKAQIQQLQAKGADIIVCLAHLGIDPSTEKQNTSVGLAEALGPDSGLDVIVDGHSHSVYNAQKTNGILIQQTGTGSKNVGRIKISLNGNTARETDGRLISAAEAGSKYTPDPAVTEKANQLIAANADKLAPVVGKTDSTLWGGTINGFNEARIGETNLGSLIADAMANRAEQLITNPAYQDLPVVALQNGGGVRTTIQRGDITIGDSLNVLPFGNSLAFKEVTPKVLYEALENGVSKVVSQNAQTGQMEGAGGCFPQISGMRFAYNPDKAVGERVQAVYLDGSETPLDRNDTSTKLVLASNDFEIAGGDGYTMLSGLPSIGEGGVLEEVVRDYYTALTNQAADKAFNLPISTGRIQTVGAYQPTAYNATVLVNNEGGSPIANTEISYRVDGGVIRTGLTNANGLLPLVLPDGPHAIRVGDAADVLVNNYSGAGIQDGRTVAAVVRNTAIRDVTLSGITVQAPDKTVYQLGEELDIFGMAVTAQMSDGGTEDVTAWASLSGYDKNKPGGQTVSVSYAGKTAAFTVTVQAGAGVPTPDEPSKQPSGSPSGQPSDKPAASASAGHPSAQTGDAFPAAAGAACVLAAGVAAVLLKRKRS